MCGVPVPAGGSAFAIWSVVAWTRWLCVCPQRCLSQWYTPPSMCTVPVELVDTGWRGSMCSRSEVRLAPSTKIIFFAPPGVKTRLL